MGDSEKHVWPIVIFGWIFGLGAIAKSEPPGWSFLSVAWVVGGIIVFCYISEKNNE